MADRRAYGAAGAFPKSAESVDEWLDAIQMGMYKMNFPNISVPDLPARAATCRRPDPQPGARASDRRAAGGVCALARVQCGGRAVVNWGGHGVHIERPW